MRAGDVFLGGHYAALLESGQEQLPDGAREGPYKLGAIIMVAAASMGAEYRLPDLPDWILARVCLPPPVEGQWYRWYDPFIWFETEIPIHVETEHAPSNMSCVGNVWSPLYRPEATDKWAYPVDVWNRLIGGAA